MRSLKFSVMSLLVLGACGAVAYNVLLNQAPNQKRLGSTAVSVQVGDVEVSSVARDQKVSRYQSSSPIGNLLQRSSQPGPVVQQSLQDRALTASIQGQLSHLGYYKGNVDGQLGPQTQDAIVRYQSQNSLRRTGSVSDKLLDHIKFTRKIADAGSVTGSIKVLNPQTRTVQERLTLFGYKPGKIDGVMGSATINAIKLFQTDRSLPVTGRVTAKLLQELGT